MKHSESRRTKVPVNFQNSAKMTIGWGGMGAVFGAIFGALASLFHGGPELTHGVLESLPAFALMGAVGGFLSSFESDANASSRE